MRLEYSYAVRPDLNAIHAALAASGVQGITGVSCYSDKLYVEIPLRDEIPSDELDAINQLVQANLLAPCWDNVRRARESLLVEADWRIQRAEDQGVDTVALRAYRQSLRDITKHSDPNTVEWPAKPW
jgi:hypothetical protein